MREGWPPLNASQTAQPAPQRDGNWRVAVGSLTLLTLISVWALFPDQLGGRAVLAGFTATVVAGGAMLALMLGWREIVRMVEGGKLEPFAVAVIAILALAVLTGIGGSGFVLAAILAVIGATLIGREARADADERQSLFSRSGWQSITEGKLPEGSSSRELAGVLAIALALIVLASSIVAIGGSSFEFVFFTIVIAAAAAIALSVNGMARNIGSGGATTDALDDMVSRQEVSAHLHDSVLQTLALIQRKADDPEAVSRLARRQEASLRLWLSGDGSDEGGSVAAAMRGAIEQVEDEESVVIDTTIMGSRPSDERSEALVAAAREALRNAARHADATTISIYVEINDDGIEAFVRDDGNGFDSSAVSPVRRGVRDSIVARMEGTGGYAKVQSIPGSGTEVQLSTERPRGSE